MNVKRYTSLYNNDHKAWASSLENQIINHNSNIEALQDLAGQFIEAVNQYKDNPRESNYYVLIKTYKPLIDDMTQKKYNDSLFKQVKEAYHQITNFNTVWARDFDAYQALIEASKIIENIQNQTMTSFEKTISKHIKGFYPNAFVIQNFFYKKEDRKHKVDLIIFLKGHIYILNCHDYKGVITGLVTSDMWQNQFLNSQTFQEVISKTTSLNVPNPLKQNYSDIEYFNTLVPFEYESIALFSDDLEIKVTGRNVLRESEFSLYLSKIEEKPVDTKLICYLLMIENAID